MEVLSDLANTGALVAMEAWAIVGYVNRKVEKISDDRKDGDIKINDRINELSKEVYYIKGNREK